MTTELWIMFVSTAVLLTSTLTYKMGRMEGHEQGWVDGFCDGSDEGYENGFEDGRANTYGKRKDELFSKPEAKLEVS